VLPSARHTYTHRLQREHNPYYGLALTQRGQKADLKSGPRFPEATDRESINRDNTAHCVHASMPPAVRGRFFVNLFHSVPNTFTSLSLTHTGTCALSLSLTHTGTCALSLSHTHTGTCALSLSLTHTGTCALSLSHTHTGTCALSLSLTHTGTCALSLSHTHTGTCALSLSLS
jgi:hypothetical protein